MNENIFFLQSHGTLRKRVIRKTLSHHLYFCMQNFRYQVGDDAMVYFYLYDEANGGVRQISERFSVFIYKTGYSSYLDKVHSNTCVFIDLGNL